MKALVVFILFGVLVAAIPMRSEKLKLEVISQPEDQKENTFLSAAGNPTTHGNIDADRFKRFIFFSKLFYPYPATTYTKVADVPVVTPIVRKTKIVAPAPVAYTYKVQLKPVTYQYTYTVPTFTVIKAAPAVKSVVVSTPAVKAEAGRGKSEMNKAQSD